jgi:protease IV
MTDIQQQPRPPLSQEPHKRRKLSPVGLMVVLSISFFFVFVLATGLILKRSSRESVGGSAGGTNRIFSGKKQKVGVLEVSGVIREAPAKRWLKQLKKFEEDENVKALVLRVNSPGGAVAPSQELYQALLAFKKPLVVSMASVAASGGYYIALGGSTILANPGTITGSIGVIMEFANLEKLYDWAKVQRFSIKTGKFKDAGAEYRTMTPEERKLLQDMVDSTLVDFRETVAKRRKLNPEQALAVSDGRIFNGTQAKAAGLVDEIGTLDDAIRIAGRLGKIEGEPKVAYPSRDKKSLIDWVMDEAGDRGNDDEDSQGSTGWVGMLSSLLRSALELPEPKARLEPGIYWLLPWGY